MSEHPMETRRRSRSKTPFLRSACDHENCEHAGEEHVHHHKKRSAGPSVHTILEETIEVSSSSTPTKRAQLKTMQLPTTSDYSSEDNSPEINRIQSAMGSTNKFSSDSTHRTVITKTTRLGNSVTATSTPKAIHQENNVSSQFIAQSRATEEAENALNTEYERSQQTFGRINSPFKSFSRLFGTFNASNAEQSVVNGGLTDHLAYKEYKRAGEYWKTTPKTDYTYSELSPYRRELAPGIVAMPNMSRRSLDQHSDRIHYMIERNPSQEQIIRRRYEKNTADQRLLTDSGDEIDYIIKKYSVYAQKQEASWLTRIVTTIITTITSVWSSSEDSKYAANNTWYSTSTDALKRKRGFFGAIGHAISSVFYGFWYYIYAGISSVLYLDTWLLQSSHADNRGKKRFFLLLLLLLPFLLIGAWLWLHEEDRLYYLERSQALVPLTLLASLRNSFQDTSAAFKARLLELPELWTASSKYNSADPAVNIQLHNLEQNIRQALTPQEYENILRHVDSYMQQLVNVKLQAQEAKFEQHRQNLTPEQIQIIVQLMRENLERVVREKRSASTIDFEALSEADVQRLVQLISLELESRGWSKSQPVKLTAENLGEIKRLITENIEINNHAHYKLIIEKIDVDLLLKRILSAPQLSDFIDSRINLALVNKLAQLKEGSGSTSYEEQQLMMNELNKEIAFIKLAMHNKLAENAELEQSISQLKVTQDDLLKRMQEHVFATDKRFSTLLSEIENKLNLLKDEHFTLLNQQVKLTLVDILGFKQTAGEQKLEDIDLQNWVRSTFVAKDYLEEQLLQLNKKMAANMREEIDRSSMLLMRDVSERVKKEILLAVEAKHNENTELLKGQIRASLSEEEVRKIVSSVLAVYDADKTGLVDFALESAGGQVLSTRCTESYQTKSAQISVFGIPLWYPSNTPRVAISPNVQPGQCWAFQGFPGFLVLKLNSMIYVTGFTLEHIPKSLSPTGRIDSAPRNFTVWGLLHEKDQDPVLFGEYEYVDTGASLQYFRVLNMDINRPYNLVELRIETNHGHPQYTCLYRFRVHGKPSLV